MSNGTSSPGAGASAANPAAPPATLPPAATATPANPLTGNVAILPGAIVSPKSDPYAALVQNPNDLLAALAYVAYKHHEIEFIKAIEAGGTSVSDDQLVAFRVSCCVDSQLEKYTARAEKLVNAFLSETLEKKQVALETSFKHTATGSQLQEILAKLGERRTWRGWLADAANNLGVQAATILLVAGLFFGFRALDSIAGFTGRLFGVLEAEGGKPAADAKSIPPPAVSAGQRSSSDNRNDDRTHANQSSVNAAAKAAANSKAKAPE